MQDEDLETFDVRSGTIDYGKTYEYVMAAYYALHLANDDSVVDFKMSTNNQDMGAFDDVVIELEFENNDKRLLAIQLKHHAKEKIISLASLASEEGDFSVLKYFEQYKKSKPVCQHKYKLNFSKFHFILFTNSHLGDFTEHVGNVKRETDRMPIPKSSLTVFVHDKCAGNDLINTCTTNKGIFRFEDTGDKLEDEFLAQFSLYTKQKRINIVQDEIHNYFRTLFGVDDENIVMTYIRFFGNWWQGLYGLKNRSFKLTKNDVKLKIAELILSPFILEPTPLESNAKANMLLKTMNSFEVSIVRSSDSTVVDVFRTKINYGTRDDLKEMFQKNIKVFNYVKKFGLILDQKQVDQLTDKQVLLICWYLNLVPLVLKADAEVSKLIPVLKFSSYTKPKKFVLLGDVCKDQLWAQCNVLEFLSDLNRVVWSFEDLFESFTFLLQDRHQVTINELVAINPTILDVVSVTELVKSVQEPLLIGQTKEVLPEYYINRFISKTLFDVKVVDESEDFVVVSCNGRLDDFKRIVNTNTVSVEDYLALDQKYTPKKFSITYYRQNLMNSSKYPSKYVLVTDKECTMEEFRLITYKTPNKSCHHFRFLDLKHLEWVQSSNINSLKHLRKSVDAQVVPDLRIFDHFTQPINVLCGEPGMGKSVMVDFLSNTSPSDFWTIKIDLNQHFKFFKNSHKDLFAYLLSDENDFSRKIFEQFRASKRVIVLWDGFDEMPQEVETSVLRTVADLKELGFRQWITGRFYCQDVLEQTLQLFVSTLIQLTPEEQKQYALRRLKDALPANLLDKVVAKMYENLTVMSKCDYANFAGVPLQVYMLTEIFLQDPEKYADDDVQIITIADIYQKFFDDKFASFYNKLNPDLGRHLTLQLLEYYQKDRMAQYGVAALKSCLYRWEFGNLKVNCDQLIKDIVEGKDNLGFIVRVDDDGRPIFVHRSYSEFLVAAWFSVNVREMRHLTNILFRDDMTNVRLLFDVIMAKNSPIHLAILYQNYQWLETCAPESLTDKDAGGRNPLQVACAWGYRCPAITTYEKTMLTASSKNSVPDNLDYTKLITTLLCHNDPLEVCELFQWNAVTYGDQACCLSAVELVGLFNNLVNFKDLAFVCHYSILYDYNRLFDHQITTNVVPFLRYFDGGNFLHTCAQNNRRDHMRKLCINNKEYARALDEENKASDSPLVIAAMSGNLDTMRFLLELGAKVDGTTHTPLIEACKGGHKDCCVELLKRGASKVGDALVNAGYSKSLEIVELLIRNGADVNFAIERTGLTALHCASTIDNPDMVKCLLEHGADPKKKRRDGSNCLDVAFHAKLERNVYEIVKADRSIVEVCDIDDVFPLLKAIAHGYDRVVDLLIKQGADVNKVHYPSTPLIAAVDKDSFYAVSALLSNGADPNLADANTVVPLWVVRSLPILELLVDAGADVNSNTGGNITPLCFAAYSGRLEIVKRLVELGAEVNHKDAANRTVLYYASNQNDTTVMEFLLQNGAQIQDDEQILLGATLYKSPACMRLLLQSLDVNRKDPDGRTVLHFAAAMNNVEVVRILRGAGADVNVCDEHGFTPLSIAAIAGDCHVIKELIAGGAHVNPPVPPLHLAASMGDLLVVSLLLDRGADPNKKCTDGFTPLYKIGCKNDHKSLVQAFQHGLFENWNYHINDNHKECLKLMLEHGSDVDALMDNSLTALHLFAFNNQTEFMEMLIAWGACPNVADKYNQTPLHYCCINGNTSGVMCLVNNGATIDVVDSFGKTPLCWAVERGRTQIMRILVNSGADVNHADAGSAINTTPLLAACTKSDSSTVEWLLQHGADVNQSGDVEKLVPYSTNDFQFAEQLIDVKEYGYKESLVNLVSQKLRSRNLRLTRISPLNMGLINGDEEVVDLLLRSGADVNQQEQNGWNSFRFVFRDASSSGMMHRLLQAGASVNVVNEGEFTPLCVAFRKRDEDLFRYLIEYGADVNQPVTSNGSGLSILHLSTQTDDTYNFTKLALKSSTVNVNVCDDINSTPLIMSVLNNCPKAASLLLDAGANVDHQTNSGQSALYIAASFNNLNLVQLLCERGADVNLAQIGGVSPLYVASHRGNVEIVDFLLYQPHTCVNYKTELGATPLAVACNQNHLEIVRKLCGKGAFLDIVDLAGKTPLVYAVAGNAVRVVEYLCEIGASVNYNCVDCATALHVACAGEKHEIAECLLKFGADVNGRSDGGVTPLFSGLMYGPDLDVVKLLHRNGARLDLRGDGLSTLQIAAMRSSPQILKYLIDNGCGVEDVGDKGESVLHVACLHANYEAAMFLLEMGANPDAVDFQRVSVLQYAINGGDLRLVQLIVDKGVADLDATSVRGNTAVYTACFLGHLEIVKFLHSKGVDMSVINMEGESLLHAAAKSGSLEVVRFLVQTGIDVRLKNNTEQTALDAAASNEKTDIVEYLSHCK